MVSTGNRIQAKRVEKGLSRSQLAEKLEITRLQVWRIETGKTHIRADQLHAFASALETTVAELVA